MLQCSPPVDFIVGRRREEEQKKKAMIFTVISTLHGNGRCSSWEGKVLSLTPSERFSVEKVIVIARLNETASKLRMLSNVNSYFFLA